MPSEDQRMARDGDMKPKATATGTASPHAAQPGKAKPDTAQTGTAAQPHTVRSNRAEQGRAQPDTASSNAQQGTILSLQSAWRHAGIWAPLHPIFVHFSIALTTSSFGFDLLAYFSGNRALFNMGWWLLVASLAATVFTLASGVVSRMHSKVVEGAARSFLRLHMALGPLFFGLLLTQAIWRAVLWQQGAISGLYLLAMGGVMLVMLLQGYLGGEMVYRFGLAVAPDRHARKATIARPVMREGGPS